METVNAAPNLAQDLIRIHKAITRGLTVGAAKGAQFMAEPPSDTSLRRGLADYVQALTFVLGAHHLGEDEVAFPAFKAKLPDAPYARLSQDHKRIEALLGPIRDSAGRSAEGSMEAELKFMADGLKSLMALWTPHIEMEESQFSEKAIGAVMRPDEQAGLSAVLGKHSQEHIGPPFLALPFVLFNLELEDRTAFANTLPKPVVEVLIPHEWKDKWAPMKPFLLS